MNILLIDDHMLIGKSLEITLKKNSVSEFHYISDPKLIEYTINLFKPSIVLMDIHMGEHNGLEIGKHIIQKFNIKLVFLSGFDLIEYREKAIEIGASGFLNKNIPINCLITTLKKILYDDETFFPSNSDNKLYSSLTKREKEILQ
jgi:two-component system secretion system response regulator SalR